MRLTVIIALIAGLTACVPARKFQELQSSHDKLKAENQELRGGLDQAKAELKDLQIELDRLQQQNSKLKSDTLRQGDILRKLQTRYDKINSLNDELLEKYALLQKGSQIEQQKLLAELEGTKAELQEREDALNKLDRELKIKEQSLVELSEKLKQREQRVNELESLIAEKDKAFESLTNQLIEALTNYSDKGLTVEQRDGKIYVSVEAQLLFPSGSTAINNEGKKALKQLAQVLEEQKDIEVLVEGHTDTDKIYSKAIPRNNWELSVLRATAVVEILVENSKINPAQLIAAGRSEFHPIDPADKSKNRRIEIILTPNLDKIFEIINRKADAPVQPSVEGENN
ncbi:OmpA family protein [Luteibaculum oceani]|uniref:OmpA family protein n=1 Tax=Luteibaculum oceani TaxID=1294296 RepID=A0A5C6V2B1_9FLAO|nr:OmpA family protein [Luteibaculum oceani]TXC78980.1 OmpA family protein [Luteibaculum oceani]